MIMKYSEIVNESQYQSYCQIHLELGTILGAGKVNSDLESEYYILDLIILDYQNKKKNPFEDLTPVDLLKALMKENGYSGYRLSKELNISESIISSILNYKRRFSRSVIEKLSNKFGVGKASFYKEYDLIGITNQAA